MGVFKLKLYSFTIIFFPNLNFHLAVPTLNAFLASLGFQAGTVVQSRCKIRDYISTAQFKVRRSSDRVFFFIKLTRDNFFNTQILFSTIQYCVVLCSVLVNEEYADTPPLVSLNHLPRRAWQYSLRTILKRYVPLTSYFQKLYLYCPERGSNLSA